MKPQMRQKATRKKSTRCKSKRQKATRRTYKQVIKGGNPLTLNIKWPTSKIYLFSEEKEDNDEEILNKINTYLDEIYNTSEQITDKILLLPNLKEANEAINQFEKQLKKQGITIKDYERLSKLRKRIDDIGNKLMGPIHMGMQYRADRIREKENPKPAPISKSAPISKLAPISKFAPIVDNSQKQSRNNPPPTPIGKGNNLNRKKFNIMMSILQKQKKEELKAIYQASARNAAQKAVYKVAHNASAQNAAHNASAHNAAQKAEKKASVQDILNAI